MKLDAKIEEGELERLVERCKQFYWQGNIRQLFKAIQTLVTMSSLYEEPIKVENLPVSPLMFEKTEGGVLSAGDSPDTVRKIMDSLLKDIDFNQAVSFYEQQILESAFKRHRTIRDVSTALNIPRSTLDMKRQKLGIKE